MNTSYFNRRPGVSTVIVLIAALVGGLIGFSISNSQPTLFTSTARYVVSPGPALLGGDPRDLVLGLDALNTPTIMATYTEVMMSSSIVDQAAVDIGLDPAALVDYEVSAVEVPSATLIDVSVIGPSADTAASLANATGERSATLAGALFSAYELQALDPATPPSEPSSPLPTRDALLAAVFAGGLAGFLLLQTLITGRTRPVGYPEAESDLESNPETGGEGDGFDHSGDLGDEYEYEHEHEYDDEPVTDPGSR
jgi:capsular polysaccharide biosynthesis protein